MENILEHTENKIEQKEGINPTEAIQTIESSIEISPIIDTDIALCVIKPDAFQNKDIIIKRLEDSGLYIVKSVTKNLPEKFVIGEMYDPDTLPKPIIEATAKHFSSGPSEIILVKGDNVVQKLLQVIGLKTNPALCEEDTVRYMYGDHVPEELEQGLKYYRNAAHRSSNEAEAVADVKKFKQIL